MGACAGEKFTTVQMIEKMVRMADELGRPIATAGETRQILKLDEVYNTPEETLFNLGLPPNREDGQRGFLTYETDGRLRGPVELPADPRDIR